MTEDIVLTVPSKVVIPAETQIAFGGMLLGAAAFYCLLMYAALRSEKPEESRAWTLFLAFMSLAWVHEFVPDIVKAMSEYEPEEEEEIAENAGGDEG